MSDYPAEPMNYSSKVDLPHAYLASTGLFWQAVEIARHEKYGTGKGWHELIDSGYGHTGCCGKKYSNDMALLRHLRSVDHGVGLAAKDVYGTSPWAPPGAWSFSAPNYIRFANHHLISLAKKIARFAGKRPPPHIPPGALSNYAFRQRLARDLALAYVDHISKVGSVAATGETNSSA